MTPRNSKGVLPEIDTSGEIRSPRESEARNERRVQFRGRHVLRARTCGPPTRGLQMRTYTPQKRGPGLRMHRSSMQHYGAACRCCTMEDLGHPKTVAGAVPGEFLVPLLWKIMRAEQEREVADCLREASFVKLTEFAKRHKGNPNERTNERTYRLILRKIRWRIKWVAREVKIITTCPENNKVQRINGYNRIYPLH